MIQSAMIFALGFFVSGLAWLAFSVALVRRTRRLTERRLLSGIATRRAEFETERDELRARHAVQMHRLEREVSHVLDMATSYRLEADLKERDLLNAQAELIADQEDFRDLEQRLADERELVQDLERRHAEAGSALRAAQYTLNLETKRRASAEEALDEANLLADQRRMALVALRQEADELRARLGEEPSGPVPFEVEQSHLPRTFGAPTSSEEEEPALPEEQPSGSVVPLPTRAKHPAPETPADDADVMAVAMRDLQRFADEARGELGTGTDETGDAAEPRMPAAAVPGGHVGELVALRMAPENGKGSDNGKTPDDGEAPGDSKADEQASGNAENRFFAALAEIRALKRAANQAGE